MEETMNNSTSGMIQFAHPNKKKKAKVEMLYYHLHKNNQIQEVDNNHAAVCDKKTNMTSKRKCDDNKNHRNHGARRDKVNVKKTKKLEENKVYTGQTEIPDIIFPDV
eukprot:8414405-Ditylum_brightwellii.AAC.2